MFSCMSVCKITNDLFYSAAYINFDHMNEIDPSDMDCSNDTNPNERLLDAARDGNEAVVTFFLQCNETYINVGNHDGKTPLHLASENGHASVLRLLLEQGPNSIENNLA